MMRLGRHDLVWISAKGWERHVLGQAAEDTVTVEILAHWFAKRLPLVVGRQSPGDPSLALGLAAPLACGKRKVSLRVPQECVLYHDRFPMAVDIRKLLPPRLRESWQQLCGDLAAHATHARVHGSYGWQRITGLEYIHAQSDIDLHVPALDAGMADQLAGMLDRLEWNGPRVDGELVFPTGAAVAWREWVQWRRGAVDRIMVKHLHGVGLETGIEWLKNRLPVAA